MGDGVEQPEPVQEQGTGKVGWRTPRVPLRTWRASFLSGRSALLLCVVYLVTSSVNDLTPVASRVLR